MIVKDYVVYNNKVNNILIGVFSDLHYGERFDEGIFDKILKRFRDKKFDYICVPGDILDATNVLDCEDSKEKLLEFFKELGKIAPTVVALGNHDYVRIVKKKRFYDNTNFWDYEVKNLKKDNVYLLDNDVYEDGNVRFIGCTLPMIYYYNSFNRSLEKVLIKTFKENIEDIKDNKLNILLCHSPVDILSNNSIKEIKLLRKIDMVISGHMHNGMVPRVLDDVFPKNRGIISPNRFLYPDNARGIKDVNVEDRIVTLLISGGITKIHGSASWKVRVFSCFYSPQIERIMVLGKK